MKSFFAKTLFLTLFLLISVSLSVMAQSNMDAGNSESGLASWYGPGLQSAKTAGGEVFDMYKLTAAHPSLPFNTRVRVTNLRNQKSVVVRINDRGPFIKNRIIDISKEAARQLDMIYAGVAKVKIEVLES